MDFPLRRSSHEFNMGSLSFLWVHSFSVVFHEFLASSQRIPFSLIIKTQSFIQFRHEFPRILQLGNLCISVASRKNTSLGFRFPFFFQIITNIAQLYFIELTCPLYEPPENGALTCFTVGTDPYCEVQCQSGNDFVFNPPLFYFCQGGEWQFFAPEEGQEYSTDLPWPDCAGTLGVGFGN